MTEAATSPKQVMLTHGTEAEQAFFERWNAAVHAVDVAGLTAMLADGVVFESPAVYRPYKGKAMVGFILGMVAKNLPDLHYINAFSNGAGDLVLHFKASVLEGGTKSLSLDGVDIIELNDQGQVAKLTVMIRPLRCLGAVAANMKASFAAAKPSA